MITGTLFLIPSYLSEGHDASFLAPMILDVVKNTSLFAVENVRTARRFISSLSLGLDISQLQFVVLDKKSSQAEVDRFLEPLKKGQDIGVMSEAGLPGLADPGNLAVAFAHRNGIKVRPLPGASAIQTAVISSGFNGQQFTFHGYLPIQKPERGNAIRQMAQQLKNTGYTQVFMETPFRNMQMLADLLTNLDDLMYLSISADVFGDKEFVKTLTIREWKKRKDDLHKIPAVFCIGHFS